MSKVFRTFWADETGATAIEYALIGSLVSVAIIGALLEMGPTLVEMFQSVETAFDS